MKANERERLLRILRERFEQHRGRHEGVAWEAVNARLTAAPAALAALAAMEASGGEPDVIGADADTGQFLFVDCAPESPEERRSLCYDREARESRKEHRPAGSAVEAATAMGAELLDEEQYRALQRLGEFDRKTSSWLATPPEMRSLGGALFGDRRFGRVFVYHNGVQSYYSGRGFRCFLRV